MAEIDDLFQDGSSHVDTRKKRAKVSDAQKSLRVVVDQIRKEANESEDTSEDDDPENELRASKRRAKPDQRKQGYVVSAAKAPKLRPASGMRTSHERRSLQMLIRA